MKANLKKLIANSWVRLILHAIATIYIYTLGRLLFWFSKKYTYYHTRLLLLTDWYLSSKTPSSFKHEINLYSWRFNPAEVEFVELAYGRMHLKKGDTVLDLCCGDGSYAYLFFSDLASKIDSIDYDAHTIAYAKKNFAAENITFICANLLEHPMPEESYDLVVWTSGVAYFTKDNRAKILEKIHRALKSSGKLYIKTPIEEKSSSSANQISVITSKVNFESEFNGYSILAEQQSYYHKRSNLNYILSKSIG